MGNVCAFLKFLYIYKTLGFFYVENFTRASNDDDVWSFENINIFMKSLQYVFFIKYEPAFCHYLIIKICFIEVYQYRLNSKFVFTYNKDLEWNKNKSQMILWGGHYKIFYIGKCSKEKFTHMSNYSVRLRRE